MFWTVIALLKFTCLVIVFAGIAMIWMGQMHEPFLTVWFLTAVIASPTLVMIAILARAVRR